MTILPPSPFLTEPVIESRFIPDQAALWDALWIPLPEEDLPAFIASPSAEYLAAAEIEPLLKTLFERA